MHLCADKQLTHDRNQLLFPIGQSCSLQKDNYQLSFHYTVIISSLNCVVISYQLYSLYIASHLQMHLVYVIFACRPLYR